MAGLYVTPSKHLVAMVDDNASILAAIVANHAETKNLLDTIALGTGRIEATVARLEAELGTVKADVRDLQSAVGRIETKLDRHETRLEALESRP